MKEILVYNWPVYLRTLVCVVAALLLAPHLAPLWKDLLLLATLPALWWLCASLVVSYYVYDRSPLYSLSWLSNCLSETPRRWINLHAGVDHSSPRLEALLPAAQSRVLDIFDAAEMTEPSIVQARKISHAQVPSTRADWRTLPIEDHSLDAVFLIFAAHELRRADSRARLFREVARVLRKGGEVILVEHLRDWANFLAFGPGFMHFLPKAAWTAAAHAAGLRVRTRVPITPFVSAFVLRAAS